MSGSIRQRLALGLLAGSLLTWLVLAGWLYLRIEDDINTLYDTGIADTAHLLEALVVSEAREYGVTPPPEFERFVMAELKLHLALPSSTRARAYEVAFGDPVKHLRSARAPAGGLTDRTPRAGFRNFNVDGEEWRSFTLVSEDGYAPIVVAAGEPVEVRRQVTNQLVAGVGAALAGSFGLLMWLSSRAVRWSLAPVDKIRDAVAARTADNLQAMPEHDAPLEVRPLVSNLNALFARLDAALRVEREFTADAAHELRTPIAGIRMQAQVAQRTQDQVVRQGALGQIITGIDHATHLIEQLLNLARVDPELSAGTLQLVPLADAIGHALSHVAQASTKGRIDIAVPADLCLRANAEALDIALRNLIDNALKHGGEPPTVRIGAQRVAGDRVRVSIEDNGRGIPGELQDLVQKRFVRAPGTRAPGSGLGLAIVARIVELHQATISFDNRAEGGLCIVLEWPGLLGAGGPDDGTVMPG